ncbi:dTDP-4-dehydrorhamnose reductase [Chloroherpeton thalassium ATCC 35110]|uniref:dTDP-4-dehydrorhamnose reductase n=1 Tax=Chloroherpeton thalassium (strain ATCC 35110 / GB-78) TaxID=517418 RepID=B3QZ40_CHLT3|nr:SDR family oxidoreductase [Chloroherpeton thalassium]ACF13733.1 dTDP-4-dehydrorhamnose reductase [Chloroherpeton thalassium ATCC 35110]
MTKVLLTGASGLLGGNILKHALANKTLDILPTRLGGDFSVPEAFRGDKEILPLDIRSQTWLWNIISQWKPEVIIHTAALSEPGACEWQRETAEAINTRAVKFIADLCEHFGIRLIFISTDLVFDGTKGDYLETDPPNPLNFYAETKCRAEEIVASSLHDYVILRTSLLLGASPQSLRSLDERLKADGEAGKTMTFFTDEYRNPIAASVLADITLKLASGNNRSVTGLFHAAGKDKVSRFELGEKLCQKYGISRQFYKGARQDEVTLSVPRPKDTSLISDALLTVMNFPMPSLDEMITALP